MQQQLKLAQQEYSEFLVFCQEVSKMFEVGKCYQMKSEIYREDGFHNILNLGSFSHCLICVPKMSVNVVFETLISIGTNYDYEKEFKITDNSSLNIEYTAMIEHYKICEVPKEHFLNMQSRVIALQATKRQLIKELTQKQPKIDNSIFTAI